MRRKLIFTAVSFVTFAAAAFALLRPRAANATPLCTDAICVAAVCEWSPGSLCAFNHTGCNSSTC